MYKNKYIMLLIGVFFSNLSSATLVNWDAVINGSQEVPPNMSRAVGVGTGTLDTDTGLLNWDISWTGLTATSMHFHGPALPNQNAGVELNFGAISGLTSPSIGNATIDPDQVSEVLDGLWYINIHTAEFPGGEIRGQVIVNTVPVPATVWLFGSALIGLFGIDRIRKPALSNI